MTRHELAILEDQAMSDARILDESHIVGDIRPADPADVMLVSGYFANLPKYHVDWVYQRNGKTYVDVSPAGRSAFEPADVTTYRFEIVEGNSHGEDVEYVSLTEIEWSDGTKRYERGEEP